MPTEISNSVGFMKLGITTFNRFGSSSTIDTVNIVNVNNKPPEFISNQRVFEIEEVFEEVKNEANFKKLTFVLNLG